MSKAGGQGTSPSRWHTAVNSVRPHEHETSAFMFEQRAVQTMAAVTAPPVAPCACHYIILRLSLSLSSAVSFINLSHWSVFVCCSLAVLSSAISDVSLSCWLALICCSLVVLSSAVSDASQSLKLCSLASELVAQLPSGWCVAIIIIY